MHWAHGNHAGCPIPKLAPTWSYACGCDGQLLKAATLPSTPSTALAYRGRRNTQRPGFVPGLFLRRLVGELGGRRARSACGGPASDALGRGRVPDAGRPCALRDPVLQLDEAGLRESLLAQRQQNVIFPLDMTPLLFEE